MDTVDFNLISPPSPMTGDTVLISENPFDVTTSEESTGKVVGEEPNSLCFNPDGSPCAVIDGANQWGDMMDQAEDDSSSDEEREQNHEGSRDHQDSDSDNDSDGKSDSDDDDNRRGDSDSDSDSDSDDGDKRGDRMDVITALFSLDSAINSVSVGAVATGCALLMQMAI